MIENLDQIAKKAPKLRDLKLKGNEYNKVILEQYYNRATDYDCDSCECHSCHSCDCNVCDY